MGHRRLKYLIIKILLLFNVRKLPLKDSRDSKADDTRFNILHHLLLNKCWTMLHNRVEWNRAGLYFRSTSFNNIQRVEWHISTFNMTPHMHCSTFVEQELQHLLINKCWTVYHRLKSNIIIPDKTSNLNDSFVTIGYFYTNVLIKNDWDCSFILKQFFTILKWLSCKYNI